MILYQLGNNGLKSSYYANSPTYIKSTLINGCYLRQINFPNGKVRLDNSLAFEQLDYNYYSSYSAIPPGQFLEFKHYMDVALANTEKVGVTNADSLAPHRVDNIHIYDKENNEINKIAFGYQYDPMRQYRLKLYSLKVQGQGAEIHKYTFKYENSSLPWYNARQTDIYGYWSNKG